MLKRKNRLLSNYEYGITRRKGQKVFTRFFSLYYLNRNEGPTKVGIITSRKFAKTAVMRNRIKRIFREIVRSNFDKIKPGFWIIIYPKKESLNAKYEEINTEFTKTLSKAPFSKEF